MRIHDDERRLFIGDIFELPNGDINLVALRPRAIIAWHRHKFQDDRIYLFAGTAVVQAIDPDGIRHRWDLAEGWDADSIFIPRGWWHGYSSLKGAKLLQFNGPRKWDGSDEERMSTDTEPWITP